jgi:hypothetical protein
MINSSLSSDLTSYLIFSYADEPDDLADLPEIRGDFPPVILQRIVARRRAMRFVKLFILYYNKRNDYYR